MTSDLFSIFSDKTVSGVFKEILKSRILSRYQLKSSEFAEDQLDEALKQLLKHGLVEKKSLGVESLDKYYPTSQGLSLEKMLK